MSAIVCSEDEVRPRRRGSHRGPVQVLLIGLEAGDSDRMLAAELQDLRTQDAIEVLDVLRVWRGFDDEIRRLEPLEGEDHPGTLVEALLVVDLDGRDSPAVGGAGHERPGEETWFLADRVPRGTAAAILLIEHRWAIPLREAASEVRAAIFGDAWLHPGDVAAAIEAAGWPP